MATIETVTLKEMEVIKTENGFEQHFINEKKFPAAITNYSLSAGEQMGLIEGSQLTDLGDIQQLFESAIDPQSDHEEALKEIDLIKYLKVIYLAVIGVNRQLNLTYEQFTELYHEDKFTIIETYTKLMLGTLTKDLNNFSKGLEQSTKKK